MGPQPTTAIIGGGPAGCYAAYLLAQRGHKVVVFEKDQALGGRTQSWTADDWTIDSGAGFFTNFYPILWKLIKRLGIESEVVRLSRTNVLSAGNTKTNFTLGSMRSFLGFPFISPVDKLRMAWQTAFVTLKYRSLDLHDPESLKIVDDLSIYDEAMLRFGKNSYHYLVRPSIEPFWYYSCDQVSRALLLALQARAVSARFYTLKNGMSTLCKYLLDGIEFRKNEEITACNIQNKKVYLSTSLRSFAFDNVVIATTASVAHRLTRNVCNDIPDPMREYIASQSYVANMHLVYMVQRASNFPKYGSLFPCGPHNSTVAAINFNSHKLQCHTPNDAFEYVSIFLTSAASREGFNLENHNLFDKSWTAARLLCPELPEYAKPKVIFKRPEAIPIHAVGRYQLAAKAARSQRAPIVFAGDYLTTATIEGAFRAAENACMSLGRIKDP